MKLITEVALPDYPFSIDHQNSILMMGSCFTENVGQVLENYLFPICINPFGITYNPLSVKKGLEALIDREAYQAKDLDQNQDLWFSFDHDTGFSSGTPGETLENINKSFQEGKEALRRAEYLFITWGTAWVFHSRTKGDVVCNCHKIPADQFTRSRLSTREIIQSYEDFLPRLFQFNPKLRIIQTVSPVRHWKDGAHGNQLSKATLLLAGEALRESFPEKIFYFPSYEIVMDELRDYRFYAGDMLHTSDQAIAYIWEKFNRAFLNEKSRKIIGDLEPFLKMRRHRPMNKEGDAYVKMIKTRKKMQEHLMKKYPDLNWKKLEQ
ncbi:MAG: GSCFA domain-containing protein [Bacteroidota bacterium]